MGGLVKQERRPQSLSSGRTEQSCSCHQQRVCRVNNNLEKLIMRRQGESPAYHFIEDGKGNGKMGRDGQHTSPKVMWFRHLWYRS